MRAWTFQPPATPLQLTLRDMPAPLPRDGELVVAVKAVGLNPADWKALRLPTSAEHGVAIAGMDAAGTVASVGASAGDWQVGERVYLHTGVAGLGTLAEFVRAPAWSVARIPEELGFTRAAALPTPAWTAYQVVHQRLRLQEGSDLLVLGAAGAVGAWCLQLAKLIGVRVVASSAGGAAAYLRKLGADAVLDARTPAGRRALEDIAPARFDAVIDVYGPGLAMEATKYLKFGGQLACCAGAPAFDAQRPLPRGLSVHDIFFSGGPLFGDPSPQPHWREIGERVAALAARGVGQNIEITEIGFADLPQALENMRTGHSRTKFVVTL